MAWYHRLTAALGFRRPAAPQRRDFAAAAATRLTNGWNSVNTSANADLFRGLDTLRARSRDLAANNDYAKRFLGMVAANVVGGAGITLQARIYNTPQQPDDGANWAVETAWDRWGKRGVCDVTGRLSWRDLSELVIRTIARDGECLVRVVRGKSAGNPIGYALQVLDIDRLDTRLMRAPENGVTEIRMGVEVDAWGRAVAYWLRPYHPGDQWYSQGVVLSQHERVPAADIRHLYLADRPEQLRGLPWMHAAMVRLNNLGGYEEAAVIAARVGASKMGFFTSPDGDPIKDGEDAEGVPYLEADPGSFGTLPNGYDFKAFDPDYPHAMYGDFVKACLRGVASGLGVSYHGLANDLEGVNFSSIRSGTLEERDQWMALQRWYIDAFVEPIYTEWLGYALAMGQVLLANGSPLPPGKGEKFAGHTWQPRRWSWVDPLKDMEAKVLGIANGLTAPQDVAAELGVDYEDVLVKIKAAQDLAAKLGVKLGGSESPKPAPAAPDPAGAKPDATAKALAALAEQLRGLEQRLAAPSAAPNVTVNQAPVNVAIDSDEMRSAAQGVADGVIAAARVTLDQIREDIAAMPIVIPAPVVHVAAPNVTVTNNVEPTPVTMEAHLPAAEVVVSLPARRTDTTVERDGLGNIVRATQVERDI